MALWEGQLSSSSTLRAQSVNPKLGWAISVVRMIQQRCYRQAVWPHPSGCVAPNRELPGPPQPGLDFWPWVAPLGCPSFLFPRPQDRVCLCFEEGKFSAHLFPTKTCQDHIALCVLIPGKESSMKIVWVLIQNSFCCFFFNLGLILKNYEFSSNVCRYLPEKVNITANYSLFFFFCLRKILPELTSVPVCLYFFFFRMWVTTTAWPPTVL